MLPHIGLKSHGRETPWHMPAPLTAAAKPDAMGHMQPSLVGTPADRNAPGRPSPDAIMNGLVWCHFDIWTCHWATVTLASTRDAKVRARWPVAVPIAWLGTASKCI